MECYALYSNEDNLWVETYEGELRFTGITREALVFSGEEDAQSVADQILEEYGVIVEPREV